MKVWILETDNGWPGAHDGEIVGIFSSKAAAERAKQSPYTLHNKVSEYDVWDSGFHFLVDGDYT